MQDLIDQLTSYLKGIWVNKWILLIITWAVCMIGWVFVVKMPDHYSSQAKVYVDTQSLLKPLLRGLAIQSNPSQQIDLMVRTLFTRPNLEKVARLADLDIQARNDGEFDAIIAQLKNNLSLSSTRGENIYTISYNSPVPQEARNVVQATLTSLVENTLGDKRADSANATNFIDGQIADYEARLVDADNRLKEFKKRNFEVMSAGGFYADINALKQQIHGVELQLKEAVSRREAYRDQLNDEEPQEALFDDGLNMAQYNLGSSFDSRIEALGNQLDELRLRYTDRHPEIRGTQNLLDDLIVKRDEEIAQKQKEIEAMGDPGGASSNPVYQQLKISLAAEESNIRSLQVRLADHRAQLESLQAKVDTIPDIEAEQKALQRGYSITQGKYNELLSRRESARLGQQAESSSNSFQFRVIDPPRLPGEPSGPNRPLFLSGVLALGLGAGLALTFLVSQIRPVFFDTKQLGQVTGYPVLGAVTIINDPQLFTQKRRKTYWFLGFTFLLILLYLALIALQLIPEVNQKLISLIPELPSTLKNSFPFLNRLGL